jgi:predicted transcriptional regulator
MAEPASLFDIEDDDAEKQALLEAEAELDAGKGIPWDDVKRWLESWGKADELPPPTCK